jgi:hypothetical protein
MFSISKLFYFQVAVLDSSDSASSSLKRLINNHRSRCDIFVSHFSYRTLDVCQPITENVGDGIMDSSEVEDQTESLDDP